MFGILLNKRKLLTDRKALGRWGEKRCEKYLKSKGFKTLARNYSCKVGELDLVMADGDGTIVFVEVKTRADESFGPTEDVITRPKKERMAKSARYFLTTHKIENRPCRFDFVTVVLGENGKETIQHYENAFMP
ncbi:MAG: YraN family protein [Phycisphaerales bacterium]|jgi:putative endonuclease